MKIKAETERRGLWDLACLPSTQQRVGLALPHGSDLCLGNAGVCVCVCVCVRARARLRTLWVKCGKCRFQGPIKNRFSSSWVGPGTCI